MTTTWRTSTLAALAALALTAGTASAQASAPADADRSAEAAALLQDAREAAQDRSEWGKASVLYRKVADLRSDDPEAAEHYRKAGTFAYYAGREGRAVENLTRAAETALSWGDVAGAARSYLDAAWVAYKDGDGARTLDLAHRAERLARSPLLPRSDRAQLLSRIAEEPQPLAFPGN